MLLGTFRKYVRSRFPSFDWILQPTFMMVCLIFYTAIMIKRKNWRITIKLHFENLNIFLKKRTSTHMLGSPSPCSFLFAFQWPPPLPSSTNVLFEWPLWGCKEVIYFFQPPFPISSFSRRLFLQIITQREKRNSYWRIRNSLIYMDL